MDNGFWQNVEKKSGVNKDTIVDLARKLQESGLKNKDTLNEIIDTLSFLTGKKVSEEKRERIISKVIDDKVPKNVDKMF